MILVSVGTMLPFDRLVKAMDEWAAAHPSEEVFAQIGGGAYEPRSMPWARLLGPTDFTAKVKAADMVVAHAGMGSFFLSMEMAKPVVMLPRLAALHEHTTNHQVDTSRWLKGKTGVYIVDSERDLPAAIETARAVGGDKAGTFPPYAPEAFLNQIRKLLDA